MRKIIFLLIIISASCIKNNKIELSIFLTNNDCKYWDMVYNPSFYNQTKSRTFPLYCYCFDKNNNWYFFVYRKGIRKIYEQNDIVISPRWKLISDTSIMLGNKMYKIEKLTNDTFIFKSNKFDSTVLIKSLVK